MSERDMDYLARRIVTLERKHDTLARTTQLPNASVTLIDGSQAGFNESAEKARDTEQNQETLYEYTNEIGDNTDGETINGSVYPEWIHDIGSSFEYSWDATEFATELATAVEEDLTQARDELDAAQITLGNVQDELAVVQDDLEGIDTAVANAEAAATQASANASAAQTAAGNAQDAATQAADDALAAVNAAAGAQATAESKGKVIIQSAAPVTADRLAQNLWIDTTDGANTPKRWNGTAWVAVTDKAATDAAATAVAAQNTANAAFDEAVDAATAAGNALTAADGKSRNWFQNDQPTGTGHKVGDTWFDTNDGNRVYRWSGSAWVSAQFGTNAISNTAINAAKLADNAVTEAKILDGAITDDKLGPAVQNAITTAQSTATNAQTVATNAQSTAAAANTAAATAQGDAAQALADALAAANAASGAQSTANAKGKVIIQSAAPATADRLAQNLWIDTTGNANTPKRWSGSAWVAVTDKAATDAAAAAVTADGKATAAASAAAAADTKAANAATAAATADGKATAAQTAASNAATAAATADGKAVAAQTAASNAQTAANAAQTTANGKGKVIIQSAAPAAADRLAQNLWIDTTGGANTPKRWSGSAWVAVTDKAATDAAAAAVAAQQAADDAQAAADTANTVATGAQAAATAAASAASSAQSAAVAAQTTADGKNKVVRSTANASAPGDYAAGDQWWKYSGSQITAMWIHSGSAWVSQTLTDSVITNLNAGTITAGSIAAARIAANTITGTHIAGATVTAANMVTGTITAASGIIAEAAIGTANIVNGSITTAKIANLAVTNAEIANGTIQHAKIGSVDASKISVGTLDAARIAANTISAQKLLLTSFENLAQDYSFEYNSSEAWQMVSNSANETTNPRSGSRALRINTTTGAFVAARQVGRFSVAEGERYRVSAWVRLDSGTSALTGVTLRFAHAATEGGSGTTTSDVATTPTGTGTTYVQISGVWTVPAAARFAYLEIISRDTTSGKKYRVDDVEIYKMATSELIVDGAITADKITANAITAGKIATNAVTADKIAANAVTADKILANSITAAKIATDAVTAAKIQAQAIDGMTITGALIRTAASGQRIQLDVNGLRTFNSSNTVTSALTASTGSLNLAGRLHSTGADYSVRIYNGLLQITNPSAPNWSPGMPYDGIAVTPTGLAMSVSTANQSNLHITNSTPNGDIQLAVNTALNPANRIRLVSPTDFSSEVLFKKNPTIGEFGDTSATELKLQRTYNGTDRHVTLYSTANNPVTEWGIIAGQGGASHARLALDGNGNMHVNTYAASSTTTATRPIPFAFAAGQTSFTHSGTSTVSITATLPSGRFTKAPIVTCNLATGVGNSQYDAPRVYASSTTSITMGIWTSNGSSVASHTTIIAWHAVQMTSANSPG